MTDLSQRILHSSTVAFLVSICAVAWFYGVMYHWLWNGLTHASSGGWIVGYAILFVIFLILSVLVIALIIIGYWIALMLAVE